MLNEQKLTLCSLSGEGDEFLEGVVDPDGAEMAKMLKQSREILLASEKGDKPGHPFRGNQWSGGTGEGAVDFIRKVSLSSGMTPSKIDPEVRTLLRETVVKGDYELFRGVSVMSFRLSQEERDQINTLKEGDPAPEWLTSRRNESGLEVPFSSYTKKESVAKRYGKEADVEMVLVGTVPNEKIVADLTNLKRLPGIDDELVKYGRSEKEVIVEGRVKMSIHWIGRKRKL